MFMDLLAKRFAIRKYTAQQVSREDLERILQAGEFAPSAGGGQRNMFVGVRNAELVRKLGRWNMAKFDRSNLAGSYVSREQPSTIDDPTITDGFYGAPCVVCLFGQANFKFKEADAYCAAENMVLQATELGISSCIVSRGPETFASIEGRELLRTWGVPDGYECVCFVILGYRDGEPPHRKSRREGRTRIVE
ncbi:nitroreductase family protein [uncultured Senegalimassilia sp.]|uniref:nitroreductase family protein n=1 Tax=uncultured Senegalimassilia sp. TaxID=1714350 RepID=UPI00261E61FC|nr:nitroreductase family protein [uncultured Senegalimassilia sp.]